MQYQLNGLIPEFPVMDAVPVFEGYQKMNLLKIIMEILQFRIHGVLQSAVQIKRWAGGGKEGLLG